MEGFLSIWEATNAKNRDDAGGRAYGHVIKVLSIVFVDLLRREGHLCDGVAEVEQE
ncbi:hypothetical protein GW923_04865 [Candidatus Pacearchaeota archaeon]|nr:hypothetical protein [Candidatus Pacearchaeota archaeon]